MTVPTRAAIRRLAIARLVSVTGSMAAYTALIDLVYRTTGGSTLYLSLTILLTIGAVGLFEPLGGIVADRVDRKRALIWSDLAGAGAFVVLASVDAPWLLLLVALLTAIVETPFRAGSVAAVPSLLGGDAELAWANGLITMGSNAGITLGPALGGLLVAWLGAGPVFLLNAVSFVGSALLVWSIDRPFRAADEAEHDARGGMTAGFRFLRRDRVLLLITIAWMTLVFGAGFGIVADRPVAEAFDAGSIGFGAILGMWGLGSVLGSVVAGRLTAQTEPSGLEAGFLIAAAGGIGIWISPWFGLILLCNVAWGIGDALASVAEQGIVQRRTPDGVRARVFAANESLVHATLVLAFLVAGPVVGLVGAKATYLLGGVGALAAALLAGSALRTLRREQTSA